MALTIMPFRSLLLTGSFSRERKILASFAPKKVFRTNYGAIFREKLTPKWPK